MDVIVNGRTYQQPERIFIQVGGETFEIRPSVRGSGLLIKTVISPMAIYPGGSPSRVEILSTTNYSEGT